MTNEELAIAIQNGHTEYFPVLWEQCRKLLYSMGKKAAEKIQLPNYISTDDIQQEMFFAFCRAVNAYDSQKDYKLNTYFRYHVWNAVKTMLPDSRIEEVSYNEKIPGNDGEEDTELIDLIEDKNALEKYMDIDKYLLCATVKAILESIPELQRQVIILRFIHEKTLKETAQLLDLTVPQVRNAETKALRTLRSPKISKQLVDYYV